MTEPTEPITTTELPAHSGLGPSAAHRWMLCPGSVKLCEDMPDKTSPFAEEGTRAHDMAEQILTDSLETDGVDLEMLAYVEEYTSYVLGELNRCQAKQASKIELIVEETITLDSIDERLYGTVDAMFYCAAEGTLYVFDLKYGKGVEVEVEDNPQLMYYALAGWSTCFASKVKLSIVQPRIDGRTKKTVEYSAVELDKFADQLTEAIKEVDKNPKKYVPGAKQCKWCLGSPVCPAQARTFSAITNLEPQFSLVESDLPDLKKMTKEQVGIIYENSAMLTKWLGNVSEYVSQLLHDGEEVRGAKLVEQRKNRVFKNPKDAETTLKKKGHLVRDIMTSKLKTPAQLEKAGVDKSLVAELTITPKGVLVAVPESDKRLAQSITPLEMDPIEEE